MIHAKVETPPSESLTELLLLATRATDEVRTLLKASPTFETPNKPAIDGIPGIRRFPNAGSEKVKLE